jgi:hypothetical protein
MRSFISIFDPSPGRRVRTARALAAFLAAFLVLAGADRWFTGRFPSGFYRDPAAHDAWAHRDDMIFETLEHPYADYAYYHGIGPSIEAARRADVLLVGNSLTLDAFTDPQFRRAAQKSGLSIFNLSIPGSNYVFTEALMAHQRLAPRMVLFSTVYFFGGIMRSQERETLQMSDWPVRARFEWHRYFWWFEYGLQQCLPRWLWFEKPREETRYILRCLDNGCLFKRMDSQSGPGGGRFQRLEQETDPSPAQVEAVRDFKERMDRQGTRLVLVHMPSGISPRFTEKLAEALKVPWIATDPSGMTTFDGLHLSAESSELFSERFFQKLFRLALFKELMREKGKTRGERTGRGAEAP